MNLYRSPGKRALSGLILFAVGLVLSAVGLVFIGLPLFFFGLLLLFCFLGKKKAFYMGRCGTVSVVQVKEYSYPPLLFFAWPFYYVPHAVRYYKLWNLPPTQMEIGCAVKLAFLNSAMAEKNEITKEEFEALKTAPETADGSRERRALFLRAAQRFFDEGVLTEVYADDYYSVCTLPDACRALFVYKNSEEAPVGTFLAETAVAEKIGGDLLLYNTLPTSVALDDRRFSVMKKLEETEGESPEAISEMSNKTPVSRAMLVGVLEGNYVTASKTGGILQLVLAFFLLELGIAGLFFMLPMGILFSLVGGWLVWRGIKKLRSIKDARRKIEEGRFYLRTLSCTGKRIETDPEGPDDYYLDFAEGISVSVACTVYEQSKVGDTAWFLWLEGEPKHAAYYLYRGFYLEQDAQLLVRSF